MQRGMLCMPPRQLHPCLGEEGLRHILRVLEATLQEDKKLLTLYDMALTRSEEQ